MGVGRDRMVDWLRFVRQREVLSGEMHTAIERFFVNPDRLWMEKEREREQEREGERPTSSTSSGLYCTLLISFLTRLIPRNLLLLYR